MQADADGLRRFSELATSDLGKAISQKLVDLNEPDLHGYLRKLQLGKITRRQVRLLRETDGGWPKLQVVDEIWRPAEIGAQLIASAMRMKPPERTLAKVYEREQPTLVILGKQAVDGDSNQAGQLLAEYLGLPQATFASKIELDSDGSAATVTREVDGGLETIKVTLPAVVTADLRLNEPRYASLPGIMKAKRKPIDQLSLSELGLDSTLKVKTVKLEYPAERKAGVKVDSVDALVDKLQNEAKVL